MIMLMMGLMVTMDTAHSLITACYRIFNKKQNKYSANTSRGYLQVYLL